MKKLMALLLAALLILCFSACNFGGLSGDEGTEEGSKSGDTVKLSDATDKWPSGVYNAYGVPEYKSGKVAYAYPEDEYGSVYIDQTTREEAVAWVDSLTAKGFRMNSSDYDRLKTVQSDYFKIYFPNYGSGRFVAMGYTFNSDGAGVEDVYYDDDGNEIPFTYNISLSISYYGDETDYSTDLATSLGIADDAFVVDGVCATEKTDYTVADKVNINVGVSFYFDFELTGEVYEAWKVQVIDAFIKAADDGKIYDVFDETSYDNAQTAMDKVLGSWVFNRDGAKYVVQLFSELGYDAAISVMIQQVSASVTG